MKITIYTTKDCAFSKQEKEYLNTNKLVFEEKDLETNKDFLTEMLAISNNFAGTPVTRVEKNDGSIAVLKGFTKEEFDATFGLSQASPTEASAKVGATDSTVPTPVNDTPVPPVANDVPVVPTETVAPTPIDTPVTETTDPLKSVMDDLQAKSEPFDSAQGKPTPPPVSEPVQPVVETPSVDGAPSIPDFPGDVKTTV